MKKKEALFIGVLLAAAVFFCAKVYLFSENNCSYIKITVEGQDYGTYSLSEDQVISIGGTNVCEIKSGQIKMTQANCPDHLCLKQPAIGNSGGFIVCMPNQVVIQGKDALPSPDTSEDVDAMVG